METVNTTSNLQTVSYVYKLSAKVVRKEQKCIILKVIYCTLRELPALIFRNWVHFKQIYILMLYNICNIIIIIIIIIYHDFLPTPRRGSHVKSGKTHTQSSRYTP